LAALVVLVLLAGCGGGSGSTSDTAQRTTSATRAAPVPKVVVPQAEGEAPPTTKNAGAPTAGDVVAIDPGHNGANGANPSVINQQVPAYADGGTKECDTTGTATDDGALTESAFNLDVALAVRAKLQADGIKVVMTRTSDNGVGPCINKRAEIGNRAGADAAVSIHADGNLGSGAHGFDINYPLSDQLVHPSIFGPSHQLAVDLRDSLQGAGVPPANYIGSNGLDGRDDLGGLNLSSVPKVLAELGNMRDASEAAQLESPAYRSQLAAALAKGVERFLAG